MMKTEQAEPAEKGNPEKPTKQKKASISKMFRYADAFDGACLFFGCLAAACCGASQPVVMVIMGQMLDHLNSGSQSLQDLVNQTCFYYCIVGSGMIFFSICQVTFLTITGERNAQRLRAKYVKAILAQEVGWFDTVGAAELSTKVADNCGKLQDGMGVKLGK